MGWDGCIAENGAAQALLGHAACGFAEGLPARQVLPCIGRAASTFLFRAIVIFPTADGAAGGADRALRTALARLTLPAAIEAQQEPGCQGRDGKRQADAQTQSDEDGFKRLQDVHRASFALPSASSNSSQQRAQAKEKGDRDQQPGDEQRENE
jgi:hypothetical protein